MAKTIKLTNDILESIKEEFLEKLATAKFSDGKISYTKTFGSVARKAKIIFTETAWIKMQELVRRFDTEVGWHGIAKRGADETKDEYIISDILVYPQVVASVTVTPDQVEYQNWLMSQPDEIFNHIRMQGHSHVNMATSPSGVDTNFYESILSQMDDTMFYIFMIWNKKGDKTIKIYDMAKNVLFETADCTLEIEADELGIEKFVADAKSVVRTATAQTYKPAQTVPSYWSGGYNGSSYSGYSGYQYDNGYYGWANSQQQTTPKVAVDSGTAKTVTAPEKKEEPKKSESNKFTLRRGKRRDKSKKDESAFGHKSVFGASLYDDVDDDSSDYWERWR